MKVESIGFFYRIEQRFFFFFKWKCKGVSRSVQMTPFYADLDSEHIFFHLILKKKSYTVETIENKKCN